MKDTVVRVSQIDYFDINRMDDEIAAPPGIFYDVGPDPGQSKDGAKDSGCEIGRAATDDN